MKSNLYLPDGCLKIFLIAYLTRHVEEPHSLSFSKISAQSDCITLSTCETDSNAPLDTLCLKLLCTCISYSSGIFSCFL